MTDIAIRVENLGKQYRIGKRERYHALRDTINDALTAPYRWLRHRGSANGNGAPEHIWALKDISFEVPRGEVVGIVGRNGAGKSTLLKVLSRITEPTEGRAEIHGRVGSLLEVGTGFHPELTGRENVYLNGAILGMHKAEIARKFDEIVAFAEIEKFIDTPVKHFSSGMYMRLAFAVAAHLDTDILIVDEVLAVGDAEFQKKCLGKMGDLSKGGRTVLFVSHNLTAVRSLCGTGILLENGRLRRQGPIHRLIGEYTYELAKRNGSGTHSHSLGPALKLGRLEIDPSPVTSGAPLSLTIQLIPDSAISIKEIALLIYSEYGERVAVLDLRQHGLRNLLLEDDPFEFRIHIPNLPLVEGKYRLGFYIATSEYADDYLDVAILTVRGLESPNGVVPYPADVRGYLELGFSVGAEMAFEVHQ
ncbi:MAG: polysaccharide ABC transporter ATP-binding protein [Bryobacteraceae bacterium]